MSIEAPQSGETGAPEGGQTTEPTTPAEGGPKEGSLEALLSGLDETARAAVLGQVEKARSEARGLRARVKEAEPKLAEWEKLVEASKTDAERAAERLTAAEAKAAATTRRLVAAEVRAHAGGFADPADAALFLKPAEEYLDADGDVDAARIKADLAAVLKAKPHLAKTPDRRGPAPDPLQGASTAATGREAQAQALAQTLLGRRR